MPTQKQEPGSLSPYPFTNDDLRIKAERHPLAPEKEIVIKSQLLMRAQKESQVAEELFRTCCDMITKHGFHVSEDTFAAPSTDRKLQEELQSARQDNQIRRFVEKSDLYRTYKTEQKVHPMCCADDIIRFMQELVAVRRKLYFQYDGYQKGQDGEDTVGAYLEQLAEVDGHIICNNLILNKQVSGHSADTSEIDFCVITKHGLVLCEIKNIDTAGHKRIHISKANRWEVHDKRRRGEPEIPPKNPIDQNNAHDRDLRKFLKDKGYGFVRTMPVIVIANTNVEIVNESENDIIYISGLDNIFRRNQGSAILTREQMEDIARLLQDESETVKERAFELDTITGIADSIKDILAQLLDNYKQEQRWANENTALILNALQQEKKKQQEAAARKEKRRRGCYGCLIASLVVCILGFCLFFSMREVIVETINIAAWKTKGTGIFANYFDDTIVLTTHPIDEYNGQVCTDSWKGIDEDCIDGNARFGSSLITTVIILDDLYPESTKNWFCGMESLRSIEGLERLHLDRTSCMADMFSRCNSLNFEVLVDLDVSNVTDMSSIFSSCENLEDVSFLADWDISNVTDMSSIFSSCENLEDVSFLADWDISNVTDMSSMFAGCKNLEDVSFLADWDVSNVTDMNNMFAFCENLEDVGFLTNWDVSNVTYMLGMFLNCTGLQNIDGLSNWDTSNVQELSWMFSGCSELQHGDLSRWNTSNVFGMNEMFRGCVNLRTLGDLSSWDISSLGKGDSQLGTPDEYTTAMFADCNMLDAIPEWYRD